MELRHWHGKRFTAIIGKTAVEGKICVEDNCVFLCQDKCCGQSCCNKLGYKYSWCVKGSFNPNTDTSDCSDSINSISNFKVVEDTDTLVEDYRMKDWGKPIPGSEFHIGDEVESVGIGISTIIGLLEKGTIVVRRHDNAGHDGEYEFPLGSTVPYKLGSNEGISENAWFISKHRQGHLKIINKVSKSLNNGKKVFGANHTGSGGRTVELSECLCSVASGSRYAGREAANFCYSKGVTRGKVRCNIIQLDSCW